jgi:hypothetical protein
MAKKISKCVPWLTHLLNKSLPPTRYTAREKAVLHNRSVNLLDGSCVKQVGKEGKVLRIHMCYGLTESNMAEVTVTDHHVAESFSQFTMTPGSIYIGDSGVGIGKNLHYAVSRQADALLRVTPNHIALSVDSLGKQKIDMAEKLDTKKRVIDFTCYVHTENRKYIPARIIASRLPEDKAEQAIKRIKRNAQRRQYVLKKKTLVYGEWVVLMTSLEPEEFSAADLLALYRTRWQVELLFKRIKQFFKVTRIKAATLQHSCVIILVWLFVWALVERQVVAAERRLIASKADMSRYSLWTMCKFFFDSFKALICAPLAFSFDLGDQMSDLYRRLRNHKASRTNQFAQFRFDSPAVFS